MRRAAKIDANQPEIVEALRKRGASVQILSMVGGGCTDLLVGYMGVNHVVEIKDGDKPPSERRLTPDQEQWHANWRGAKPIIVTSVTEALAVLDQLDWNLL